MKTFIVGDGEKPSSITYGIHNVRGRRVIEGHPDYWIVEASDEQQALAKDGAAWAIEIDELEHRA